MPCSGIGCVCCGQRRPGIVFWVIAAAGVFLAPIPISTPNDHLEARPYGRMVRPPIRGVYGLHRLPCIGFRVVDPTVVEFAKAILPSPDDHPVASPDRRMVSAALRGGDS